MSETLLSPTHRPGAIQIRSNPNTDSDCDYFTCPGCGVEIYSSIVHAWAGIECKSCGCEFSALDEGLSLWDFDVLPTAYQDDERDRAHQSAENTRLAHLPSVREDEDA